jgi:putative Mg2+ transporter-C (MgtC) family protein
MTMPIEQAAINLAVALGLSAVIGFERQWRNRLPGLRTNTLVSLGAATFVISVTEMSHREPLASLSSLRH